MSAEIVTLESIIGSVALTFGQVSVDKSIDFRRESEFALQVLYASEYARGIAMKNPQSVRDAVTNIAAIGITLNPAKKQAYLVPRDGKICLDISAAGMLELAVSSGSIMWAKTELVRQSDAFSLNGYDKPPTHSYNPFGTDRGDVVGAYSVAKTRDGDYLTETMTIAEMHAIRDRSSSWKAWIEKKKKNPWVTDEGEMLRKTIQKRAAKGWPKSDRLDQAIHYLNTDGGQGIDFNSVEPAELLVSDSWVSRATLALTVDSLKKISKEGARSFNDTKDREGYTEFAKAVQTRGAVLRNQEVVDVISH